MDEINQYIEDRKNIKSTDNMTLYMLWEKPLEGAEFTVDIPDCGQQVLISQEAYGEGYVFAQSYTPVVKKISGEHIILYSIHTGEDGLYSAWVTQNNPGYLSPNYWSNRPVMENLLFKGTMDSDNEYYAAFSAAFDFGYYVNDIEVNNISADFSSSSDNTVRICAPIKVAHDFGIWTKSDDTKHQRSCTNNDYVEYEDYVWDEGKVEKEPTETEEGTRLFECKLCDAEKTEIIPPAKEEPKEPDDKKEEPKESDDDKRGEPSEESKTTEEKSDEQTKEQSDDKSENDGLSEAEVNKLISGLKDNEDMSGSGFSVLTLKSSRQTKNKISLSWNKVNGAAKYNIYGNRCGKSNSMKKLGSTKTIKAAYKKVAGNKVRKGTYYKFLVVAFDKNDNAIAISKVTHIATKGGRFTNPKSVSVKSKGKKINRITLKKGKTVKLKCSVVKTSKKFKLKTHRKLSYKSGNTEIATVSKSGVIKGKKKGNCYIYVYAQSGVYKKIKVTVK